MTNLTFKLISLAREFTQNNTVSIYDLLQETGYAKIAGQVSEQDLYEELSAYPGFANDWLEYSEDKRCTGWYFKLNDDNNYLVGFFDESGCTETEYNDKLKACATFVKHELDEIIK